MNPSDCGIYDRVVIQVNQVTFFQDLIRKYLFQELIKTVASAHQLNTEGQREFKVSILQYTTNTTVSADPIRLVLSKHGF